MLKRCAWGYSESNTLHLKNLEDGVFFRLSKNKLEHVRNGLLSVLPFVSMPVIACLLPTVVT